jgi:recombination protein U
MAWTTGLRGNTLESLINITNDIYRRRALAVVEKIPTPITPVRLDAEQENIISSAYIERKSTVDYIGAAQGIPVCFDAKETNRPSLPLRNVHAHQIEFMRDFSAQGGAAFIIVYFRAYDEKFFMPFEDLAGHAGTMSAGGRKSIPIAAFNPLYRIEAEGAAHVHWLPALDTYLKLRGGRGGPAR